MFQQLTVNLRGTTPASMLLCCNERLSNPLDPIVQDMKKITSKTKKSMDDLLEIRHLEFLGGLYLTADGKVGFPTWNVYRSIQNGARLNRLGKNVERAVIPIGEDVVPIKHSGPSDPDKMWAANCYDMRSVSVGRSRVPRCRPVFLDWSMVIEFVLDTEVMDLSAFAMAATNAGRMIGIGDYRPRYGRYAVEIEEVEG
jgi:hypothetical protein